MSPELVGLLVGGFVAGLIGGLLGVGGGVLVVPLLAIGHGLPLPVAVGTSLVVITGTSVAGSAGYLRRRMVDFDLGLGLALGALAGAVAASRLAALVPERLLAVLFSLLLVYSAVRVLAPGGRGGADSVDDGALDDRGASNVEDDAEDDADRIAAAADRTPAPRRRLAWGLSPLAGAVVGLLGVGGGIVYVPILRLLTRLDIRRAVATSTFLVGLGTSVASLAYLGRGEVAAAAVPPLLAGILAGAFLAPALLVRIPRRVLEVAFALLLLWAAWRIFPVEMLSVEMLSVEMLSVELSSVEPLTEGAR